MNFCYQVPNVYNYEDVHKTRFNFHKICISLSHRFYEEPKFHYLSKAKFQAAISLLHFKNYFIFLKYLIYQKAQSMNHLPKSIIQYF